ncbi:hypothetical protein [Allokutzneria oryzae]|uniref:Uncharacterized protein n=1 Tax=Allokutzneria oryzae TaxID=1378989 RepID=A0ABV5ZYX0_9PSEU
MKQLPAKDRPGVQAWLGPLSLGLGTVSWIVPGGNLVFVVAACVCGVVSIATRKWYSVDWTAVAGICVALAQALLSLLLLAASMHP